MYNINNIDNADMWSQDKYVIPSHIYVRYTVLHSYLYRTYHIINIALLQSLSVILSKI